MDTKSMVFNFYNKKRKSEVIIMNYYKSFIAALSATRYNWTVDYYSEDRGPCKHSYTGIDISCDFEGDMTLDECREVIGETIKLFEAAGFKVKLDDDYTLASPILTVIFP